MKSKKVKVVLFLHSIVILLLSIIPVFAQVPVTEKQTDFFLAGNEAFGKKQYREAVQLYRTAIREEQNTAFAWFNMGHALNRLDRQALAIVAYRRTLELAPEFAPPYLSLGDLFYRSGEVGEAVAMFRRAEELGERGEALYHALGECALLAGDATEAMRNFERVLRLNPDRTDMRFAMAEVFESLGDWQAAAEVLEEALSQSPTAGAEVYFYLARIYSEQGKNDRMIRAMEDGLMLAPENAGYRRALARAYEENGSPWMAVFTLEQGLEEQRKEAGLALDLAYIFFAQKRWGEALNSFVNSYRWGETAARTGIENIGHVYHNAGDDKRAEEVYRLMREL